MQRDRDRKKGARKFSRRGDSSEDLKKSQYGVNTDEDKLDL